jgi:hypothetical protein
MLVRAAIATFAVWGVAAAQEPALSEALARDVAPDVARAAHRARELGDKRLAKPLARALAKWRTGIDDDARIVCLHLMSALLALDARVPAGDVAPLVDDEMCGVAAFALLAREPRHNEADLFALFRRDWPESSSEPTSAKQLRTLAIGNLLAPQGPPGLAKLIAGKMSFDLEIDVVDAFADADTALPAAAPAKLMPVAVQRLVRRARVGLIPLQAPAGWPPSPRLVLAPEFHGLDGETLRMPPGIGVRIVTPNGETKDGGPPQLAAGHAVPPIELQWLARMAGLASPSTLQAKLWQGAEDFTTTVTRARDQRQVFVDALRRELVARNAMNDDDAKVLDRTVAVRCRDARQDRTTPLPPIAPSR